jgi:TolB-like protein
MREPLALPHKPSIAVLPFQNMSGDPEQDYFADGIVEDITTALSRIGWLFVISRNSSFTYKGRAIDIMQVGRDLGVRYILEGSVRKVGSRVRITGQLIDVFLEVRVEILEAELQLIVIEPFSPPAKPAFRNGRKRSRRCFRPFARFAA